MTIPDDHAAMRDQLAGVAAEQIPHVDLTFRAMFGGVMGYADGRPLASLSNIGLALKIAPGEQAARLAEAGAARLRYEPDQPESKQYIVVPDAARADPARLADWLRASAAYVLSQPAPKPRAPKRAARE